MVSLYIIYIYGVLSIDDGVTVSFVGKKYCSIFEDTFFADHLALICFI